METLELKDNVKDALKKLCCGLSDGLTDILVRNCRQELAYYIRLENDRNDIDIERKTLNQVSIYN
jgi:hypothetical protein